jgi:hypothetical protein
MAKRKKRIRKHVIADLSVNYVEYHFLKAGHTMEITKSDYGYDGAIFTYNSNGEIENGNVFVQLKATDFINRYKKKGGYTFSVSKKDIDMWFNEPFPVYLILFDAIAEQAFWIYFQNYLSINRITPAKISGKSLTILINSQNLFGMSTPMLWQSHKEKVLKRLKGAISHV